MRQVIQQAFFTADILTCYKLKAQAFLITLTMALFYSSVPVSHGSVTVSQRAQYQDPEAAKWNSPIITPVVLLL